MSKSAERKGILERLAKGPVLGDGGFCFGLEKRGYVKAGPWTPECVYEHPEAVKQYHREFLRAGSDVMQAYTFYATDSKLEFTEKTTGKKLDPTAGDLNLAACRIAREVAQEGDALVSVSLSETPVYRANKDKKLVQEEFRKQVNFFKQCDVDFVICEYFAFVEEMEWAIEVAKESKLPVAASMCIGPISDLAGVSTGECAVRMAKAGADIVGINCNFGPYTCLESVQVMKKALDKAGLKPYLMIQPLAFRTPEVNTKEGYLRLPETPFALEVRTVTRFEAAKWARDALESGIHYIGGCCGFEPYHIRAMSEELNKERGKVCEVTKEKGFLSDGLAGSTKEWLNNRDKVEYWKGLEPTTGRPHSAAFAKVNMDL